MITVVDMRARLGLSAEDSEQDALIETLLLEAESYVRAFCRLREGEAVPYFLLVRMVAEDFGRLDGAGLLSRAVSGVSEKYTDGYGAGVRAQLYALRHPAAAREGNA